MMLLLQNSKATEKAVNDIKEKKSTFLYLFLSTHLYSTSLSGQSKVGDTEIGLEWKWVIRAASHISAFSTQ